MNLQENIQRIREMMGLLTEDEVKDKSNSYLDHKSGQKTEPPKLKPELEKFKKQFGNRPTTTSTTKEIKFELDGQEGSTKRWRVILPENFMNKNSDTEQYNIIDNEGNPVDVKVPLSQIFDMFGSIYIYSEGESNRIHFTQMGEFNHMSGIPSELRGIGLGYLIYEEFIQFLGFASSSSHASPEAINIWKKLYKDPEFYGVVISIDNNKKGGILLFHQDHNGDEDITVKFIKRRLYSIINEENNTNPIIIDDRLMKYPKVVEIYEDVSNMIKMPFQERIEYFNKKYPL